MTLDPTFMAFPTQVAPPSDDAVATQALKSTLLYDTVYKQLAADMRDHPTMTTYGRAARITYAVAELARRYAPPPEERREAVRGRAIQRYAAVYESILALCQARGYSMDNRDLPETVDAVMRDLTDKLNAAESDRRQLAEELTAAWNVVGGADEIETRSLAEVMQAHIDTGIKAQRQIRETYEVLLSRGFGTDAARASAMNYAVDNILARLTEDVRAAERRLDRPGFQQIIEAIQKRATAAEEQYDRETLARLKALEVVAVSLLSLPAKTFAEAILDRDEEIPF